MATAHILLCHRIPLFGECLARALSELNAIECTVLAADELLPRLARANSGPPVDLLILDPTIRADEAATVVELVRQQFPACRVLLLVSEPAAERLVDFAQLGSQGCISEDVSLAELGSAIQLVQSGRTYCSPQLANALFAQLGRVDRGHSWSQYVDDARLTGREREILQMIAVEQLGNKQIARRLHVSLYTVKNHVHNIIEKLGVQDRHEAAQVARRRGLAVFAATGS